MHRTFRGLRVLGGDLVVHQGAGSDAWEGVSQTLAAPLALSLNSSTSLIEIIIWGISTVMVQLLVFRLVDLLLRGLPQRIQEGEVAAAALLVGAKLATALILAAAVAT